jgi:hypothetical protein
MVQTAESSACVDLGNLVRVGAQIGVAGAASMASSYAMDSLIGESPRCVGLVRRHAG